MPVFHPYPPIPIEKIKNPTCYETFFETNIIHTVLC